MKYKLNPDYVPQEGHYFDSKDWTDEEVMRLVKDTPRYWWFQPKSKREVGFGNLAFMEFYTGNFCITDNLEGSNTAITKDMIFSIPKGKTLAEECLSAVGKDTKVTGKQYISDLPIHTSLSATDIFPVPQPKMFSIEDLEVTWNGEVISGFTTGMSVALPSTVHEIEISGTISAPEPKSTLYAVADVSKVGLTQGVRYKVTEERFEINPLYLILFEDSTKGFYPSSWFSSLVRVYDNDPEELEWTGVEFENSDYIDLRKVSKEQLTHIASKVPFYCLGTLYKEGVLDYECVSWSKSSSYLAGNGRYACTGKEYTYDDLFKEKV